MLWNIWVLLCQRRRWKWLEVRELSARTTKRCEHMRSLNCQNPLDAELQVAPQLLIESYDRSIFLDSSEFGCNRNCWRVPAVRVRAIPFVDDCGGNWPSGHIGPGLLGWFYFRQSCAQSKATAKTFGNKCPQGFSSWFARRTTMPSHADPVDEAGPKPGGRNHE